MFAPLTDFLTGYSQANSQAHFHVFRPSPKARLNLLTLSWQLLTAEKLACLSNRNSFDEIGNCRSANGVSSRRGNSARDCIPPPRQQLDGGARSLAKDHSQSNVGSQGSENPRGRFQAEGTTTDVHNPGNHRNLNSRKNRKVGKGYWLHSDRSTDGCQRTNQVLRDF